MNREQSQVKSRNLASLIVNSDDWTDLKLGILCNINDPVGLPEVRRAIDLIESLGDDVGQIQEAPKAPEKPVSLTIKGKSKQQHIPKPPTDPTNGIDPDLDES